MAGLTHPKVSVCIPVYNGAAYIGEAIESVLRQTFEDFSLIVSDNCSTDNTSEIVNSFSDSRITYVRNAENLGLVGNANRCLQLSDGEYICILHHDDIMLPDNLQHKVRVLDENPQVGLVHSNLFVTDASGQVLWDWDEDVKRDYVEEGHVAFRRYIIRMPRGAMIFIGAILARRACYERLGGFRQELRYANDSEMWMRILLFYDLACVGQPLVAWRQHGTNESTNLGLGVQWMEEHFLATRIIFNEFHDRIRDWKKLKKEVDEDFVAQALRRGIIACGNNDFEMGKEFLRLAGKFSRNSLLGMKDYWGLKTRLLLGPKGAKLYRPLKKKDH
jgi:glycosyltransferase involved in cell wall biosynthesis